MTLEEALEIVISLARDNLPESDEMKELREIYAEACNIVEDMAVNQFGDD